MTKVEDLIGKTIVSAKIRGMEGYDDKHFLDLEFSDKTKVTIKAYYGGYTGNSEDEYLAFILLVESEEVKEMKK